MSGLWSSLPDCNPNYAKVYLLGHVFSQGQMFTKLGQFKNVHLQQWPVNKIIISKLRPLSIIVTRNSNLNKQTKCSV